MTLEELVARFRLLADDKKTPYLFSDADVVMLLNEAEQEAAIRSRLLHESSDATITQIDVTAGTATYTLSPLLYEITHISFLPDGATDRVHLKLVSEEWLEKNVSEWRDESGDDPCYAVQGDKSIRIVPNPDTDGTLMMEGYRLPKEDMVLGASPADSPEILATHHRHLPHWPVHVLRGIPDADSYDPGRSGSALTEFEKYFGKRPDADLRRMTREDTPHTVVYDGL